MKQIFYDCGHTVSVTPCEAITMTHSEGKLTKIKSESVEIEVHYDKSPDVTLALSKHSALSLASQIIETFKPN